MRLPLHIIILWLSVHNSIVSCSMHVCSDLDGAAFLPKVSQILHKRTMFELHSMWNLMYEDVIAVDVGLEMQTYVYIDLYTLTYCICIYSCTSDLTLA